MNEFEQVSGLYFGVGTATPEELMEPALVAVNESLEATIESNSTQFVEPNKSPDHCDFPAAARILIVDDDSIVLDYVSLVLCRSKYSVLGAKSGEVAMKLSRNCGTIDLLLTDFEMPPDINGVAMARHITADRPMMRVLVMSGRDREDVDLDPSFGFIGKPFNVEQLLDAVAAMLAQPAGPVADDPDLD